MERIEIRRSPQQEVIAGVFCLCLIGVLFYLDGSYFQLADHFRLFIWICVAGIVIGIPIRLALGVGRTPCIVLDSEGVLDTRMKVGLIRWRDIRRPYISEWYGAPFVCLELHNPKDYTARMPAWGKVSRALDAMYFLPPFAMNMSCLDMDAKTLLAHLHRGCADAYAPQPRPAPAGLFQET